MKRLLLLPLLAVCACNKSSETKKPEGGGDKPVVVASIFPLHDLVRRIGGDKIESKLLLEPGKSEHNYVGSAKDAKVVSRAKVAFLIGLAMDEWTEKIVTASGGSAKIVELGEIVGGKLIPLPRFEEEHPEGEKPAAPEEREAGEEHHHDHSGIDPHLWLSIPKVKQMTPEIEKALAEAFPESKEVFTANRTKLDGELDALHDEVKKKVGAMTNKRIITFHGSFGYFAEEYGVEIAAVVEPSPGKEPSAAYLRKILSAVAAKQPLAVFTEPQLDPKPAEVLGKEGSLPVRQLDPIGGVPGRDSYELLMRFNAESLAAP
ncbi:MAG: zinc ABC transporter substrate-binding protein [Myxococcaceae bacterium]|nr:zinc ABC transporter substrate-binding protein [Myxococcaceae bacterium]